MCLQETIQAAIHGEVRELPFNNPGEPYQCAHIVEPDRPEALLSFQNLKTGLGETICNNIQILIRKRQISLTAEQFNLNDTILAKVDQVGVACHTGAKSCFFQTLVEADSEELNPLQVFESVYATILDRKVNPKEGSYTNYLFDKGIDKILKKVGEEATELVIAAKNPNPEEIKYELSDFLYHAMVLMVERGVTWDDIVKELADR